MRITFFDCRGKSDVSPSQRNPQKYNNGCVLVIQFASADADNHLLRSIKRCKDVFPVSSKPRIKTFRILTQVFMHKIENASQNRWMWTHRLIWDQSVTLHLLFIKFNRWFQDLRGKLLSFFFFLPPFLLLRWSRDYRPGDVIDFFVHQKLLFCFFLADRPHSWCGAD